LAVLEDQNLVVDTCNLPLKITTFIEVAASKQKTRLVWLNRL